MGESREEELKRIKAWIDERRKNMDSNVGAGDKESVKAEKECIETEKESVEAGKESGETAKERGEAAKEPLPQIPARAKLPQGFERWPLEIRKKWIFEYDVQKRFSAEDKQGIQIRRYLEWFEKVPWVKEEYKEISISDINKKMEEEHYGLRDVKQVIMEIVAVQKLKKEHTGLVLLLSGPPGVGKTSFARTIAKALDKPFKKIAMGGMADELLLKGSDRAYMNSFPGAIIRSLCECGTNSPVLLLDEVDKIPKDSNKGDCTSILLDILDSNRSNFIDNFLQVPIDISEVLFICTANDVSKIPKPLLDRMEHIKIKGYDTNEKFEIARRYIIPKKLKEAGLTQFNYLFSEDAVTTLVNSCEGSKGMRDLERFVTAICRRVALLHLEDCMESRLITKDFIEEQNILPPSTQRKEKRIGFYIENSQ